MSTEDFDSSKIQNVSGWLEDWLRRTSDLTQPSINSIPQPLKRQNDLLRTEEVDTVLEYLKNPIKTGVWALTANWLTDAGISQYIWQEFSQKLERQATGVILNHEEGKTTKLTLETLNDIKVDIFHRVSFILRLFAYLKAIEDTPGEEVEIDKASVKTIVNSLDLDKLQRTFSDAFSHFKDHIYFENFKPVMKTGIPFLSKNGFMFSLTTPKINEQITYHSLHPKGLEDFAALLIKLGKISDSEVMPTFSPEEQVLAPYFFFARLAYSKIINDDRLHPLFTKSFTEYEANRYESTISTLGLIGEDFLTQIYETLFRESVPKGQTMGQLYDLIQSKTAKLFQKAPPQPPDIDSMYKAVNEQIGRVESDPPPSTVDTLKLLRQAITLIKEERAYNREIAKEHQKHTSAISIFPSRIRENINDLIRFRNAASHKSRVPLSDYEALRTLHCLISLIVWWHSEIRAVNWDDNSVTIIKKMTERSTAANA
ncbi:MAG TPA: hypothetical protein VF659_19620 [Pyrinomonadaceae bacterium]|jgi:hypothetical protein